MIHCNVKKKNHHALMFFQFLVLFSCFIRKKKEAKCISFLVSSLFDVVAFFTQVAGEVYSHKYSRRRPLEGWKFTVEKLGPRGKRGGGGGWKFVTLPDGSSRPLNETEKMFLKRETPRPSRRILAPYRRS